LYTRYSYGKDLEACRRVAIDLAKAERFLSRFSIRDRDSHGQVPFILNYNQKKIHAVAAKQQDEGQPIRIIVDKARRVGVSSWAEGLGFAHCCAIPGAHFLIAAHEFKSSKALFSIPKSFAKQARFLNLRDVEREITFPHESADALMQIVTAGKDTSGRGFTLSGLHLSEAAHYKGGGEIFTSVIPAVSKHKGTIVIIESTPNGMDGDGADFYEMWMDAVEGKSEYAWVFLSWIDDPACVADPTIAKNAPIDKEEKELLRRGLTKAQLAWRRIQIASPQCGGMVEMFHQEYPTTWEESFITSGFPAFNEIERQWASANIKDPKWQGFIDHTDDGTLKLREHHRGDFCIWEDPKPGHYYYLGADAARGDDNDKTKDRDFAANVCLDGNTGRQVARYAGFVVPEVHGCYLNSIGRHYNRAMMNGELTGGYGYGTLYVVRDLLHYPNLYRWKGKDDKIGSWASGKNAVWIETTQHVRTMLFEGLRAALREGAGTSGEYGVTLYDDQLASQIRQCTRKETGRVDVKKGHDDILFGCMIANLAMRQYAPPRTMNTARSMEQEEDEEVKNKMGLRGDEVQDDACFALMNHHKKIMQKVERFPNEEEYDEIGVS
jgi:hypothetical protein